jgi:glucose-6-phosphate isomerase
MTAMRQPHPIDSGTSAFGPLEAALENVFQQLERSLFVDALWARRLDVWSADASVQQRIADRLGWLDAPDSVSSHTARLQAFSASVRDDNFSDIVLLGMGGSSLAPEVLRAVIGAAPGFPRFQVLDSVDPESVNAAMARAATSIFVLASKSGSTIEPNALAAEAERRLRAAGVAEPGSRFVAITDEGTALHHRALDQRFREVFINPSDIGGRYSALSLFGMVPAALMGIDIHKVLASARAMADACRAADPRRNPGLVLGAIIAAATRSGRDKLTLVLPPHLEPFGLWVEQLVAESTGKQGTGVVPVFGEAADVQLGDDRFVVQLSLGDEAPATAIKKRGSAQHTPSLAIHIPDLTTLGAEFFRWELATAATGWLLGVNPFDEPNVQQAKDATRVLLDRYSADGQLPVREPDAVIEGARLTLSDAARRITDPLAFLQLLQPSDYFGLLVYLPPEAGAWTETLQELRDAIATRTGVATTLGYGPRYLHSTGQLHKGGANTGVFMLVTADVTVDLPIPGASYSFGVLEIAQATGDFESLNHSGRRALHVHLPKRAPDLLRRIAREILAR